ncbi:MAG: GNAT family N-acetyltransferase [Acidobacteria bacterium]|nr:GNAT family N-acetyltransferase [Acidobacteriota bacterium]
MLFSSFQTERLILRRLKDSDLRQYHAYLNDPQVARYQTWETYSEEQARAVIEEQQALEPGLQGRAFLFALELKETGALVGHVVFTVQEKDYHQAEIGFTLAREFHRQGLAREAASRVLDYAFTERKLHRVIAITDCENLSSVALLGKLGMRREGHFIQNIWFKGKWGDEYLYAILRDEWLERIHRRDAEFAQRSAETA